MAKCDLCENSRAKNVIPMKDRSGETVRICKECRVKHRIETEEEILEDLGARIKTPAEIVSELDKYIVGQDSAKRAIAVETYNHFIRVVNKKRLNGRTVKKNNIILTGESGTGKTLIAQTLAKILEVPFYMGSATGLTESGYVGNDVESLLTGLLKASNMDVKKAQCGIIFIDEIDKISRRGETPNLTKDPSGEGVQQALLKLVEGSVVGVPLKGGRVHPQETLVDIDTTNILFICGGAFVGIEDNIKERLGLNSKKSMGFNADCQYKEKEEYDLSRIRNQVIDEDLINYGIIPEFVGRFPVIGNLLPLHKTDLVSVMKAKAGIVEEYTTLFDLQGKELTITDEALDEIAEQALSKKVGARGLRNIMSSVMTDIMFDLPSDAETVYVVDKADVQSALNKETAKVV